MVALVKILLPIALAVFSEGLSVPSYVAAGITCKDDQDGDPFTGHQFGQGTFYDAGLNACGYVNETTDYIVAVSQELFDSYPGFDGGDSDQNPICGKGVTAYYQGKSVTVTIVDSCVGCAFTDLDFSPIAFAQLEDPDVGRIDLEWEWL